VHSLTPEKSATQYQSFPQNPGDSDSLLKLKALRLPALAHKSFLDVGCNEGFFCGYALFDGANRVVGIDASAAFVSRACARFPKAEFLCQQWDVLPAEKFDVILLASALHYATDQAALIHRLMQSLGPDGTLVLELGVADGDAAQWVQVERGRDTRSFPTWSQLAQILQPYAWKTLGKSVNQSGDPVPRFVVHVAQRKPIAFLLLQASGAGKTSVARSLFVPAGIPVVSGDACLTEILHGRLEVSPELKAAIGNDLDQSRLDEVCRRVITAGLLPQLVSLWLARAGHGSFAFDGFVPLDCRDEVTLAFVTAGYMVSTLSMTGITPLEPISHRHSSAQQYVAHLENPRKPTSAAAAPLSSATPSSVAIGFLESVEADYRLLKAVGWAVHGSGGPANWLDLRIDDVSMSHQVVNRLARPDVRKMLNLSESMVGFRITIPVPAGFSHEGLARRVSVFAADAPGGSNKPLWSIPGHRLPSRSRF